MNTIHNIQSHSRLSTSLDTFQIESLREKLDFLLDFVENHHSHGGYAETEVLESQIAAVAHAAEDVIESHIADRIEPLIAKFNASHDEETSSRLLLDFLLHMMQLIEDRPDLLTTLEKKQIESLDLLLNFIENRNSHDGCEEEEVLESQIVSESQATEGEVKALMRDRFESLTAEFDDDDMPSSLVLELFVFYMEQILNHPHIWISPDSDDIEFFGLAVDYLQLFTEISYNCDGFASKKGVGDLESQVAGVALVDQCETGSNSVLDLPEEINAMKKNVIKVHKTIFEKKLVFSGSEYSFLPNLQKILEDMNLLKQKAIMVKEERKFKDLPSTYSMPVASSRPRSTGKTNVVGLDSYLIQLFDWLTVEQTDLLMISITGMGGMGKTTLARKVFEDLLVMQHFDIRVWFTISQECNVREMFYQTLSGLVKSPRELDDKTEDELGVLLHKILFGGRYLIILDDMWSIETWNKIMLYFPREEKRSRIVVTTRQSDVANHFGSLKLALDFLDYDTSWELFCEKAFEQGCCPTDLENIGRKIVKKCKGFPLSIVVIGGLLGKSSRTQEHWENVEKDLSSILNSAEDNQCFNILSLSYSYMPAHLRPCFLYLGIFLEDHEIRVSRLIKLWIAEGFLKPSKELSLEEVAKGYIKDLVDRNLLLVRSLGSTGKIKTCSMHDLLRDLCIKVSEKEKFFCLMKECGSPRDIGRERRLITLESIEEESHPQYINALQSTSAARSVISKSPCQLSQKLRLLRVFSNAYGGSLDSAFQHVNLRFLECHPIMKTWRDSYKLPSSIPFLWNLQTIIIEGSWNNVTAPSEIWEMQQLRHLRFSQLFLPKPPPLSNERDRIVLLNLRTLRVTYLYKWSEEVCKRIPNIKKLGIEFVNYFGKSNFSMAHSCFSNIGCQNKLESLSFDCAEVPSGLLQNLKFPSSLKKLSLQNSGLEWDDLTIIGSLPHLEVLNLFRNSFQGPEWNPVEGEFLRLKYLRLSQCLDLISWNADSSHFPVLENLVIMHMSKLEEIPSGIGDIPTLRDIYLVECSVSLVISAVNILKEQESLGNQDFLVRVKYYGEKQREEVRKRVELEGFPSHNFQLS